LNPELQAASFFLPVEEIGTVAPLGAGNINDTFVVTLRSGKRQVLQRLNPSVFPDSRSVMHNMRTVLAHLAMELSRDPAGGADFQIPALTAGKSGDFFTAPDGSLWRMMRMVAEGRTYRSIRRPGQAFELGRALGFFHRLLSTLDPGQLKDTLLDIHNTPRYLEMYDATFARCGEPPAAEAGFCTEFIRRRREWAAASEKVLTKLTPGIIHGDPKADNFIFAPDSDRVIGLIDLDTVQPGILLHDVGDALRSCCNTTGETSAHPEQTVFDRRLFAAWLAGYLEPAAGLLKDSDLHNIVAYVRLIAFELGIRFYTDYLDGNRYFKTSFPEQNVQRAMVQFQLVLSIEEQWDLLQSLTGGAAAEHSRKKRS
jgi:Ser/Thr protein kinase RdoA (MazF antagonist)